MSFQVSIASKLSLSMNLKLGSLLMLIRFNGIPATAFSLFEEVHFNEILSPSPYVLP